jgi:hypothetical protein
MKTAQDALAVWAATMKRERAKPIHRIKGLRITEVSLVDKGANQHARVLLMKRADDPAEPPPPVSGDKPLRQRLDDLEARFAALARQPEAKVSAPVQPPVQPPQGVRAVSLARAGGRLTRQAWLDALVALGAEAAAAQGITGLDPASLMDIGLGSPGGADILRALQASD